MRNWIERRLGEVCTLQRGFDLPTRQRKQGDYPLISSSGYTDSQAEAKVFGPGVVTGRSGSIGSVFFIDKDFWPLNTMLYVKDFHGNDPRFIFYLLSKFDLKRFASGAGVPTLNRNSVHGELVYVTSKISEQKRIVAILDEAFEGIDRAIALAEKNLANTRELFDSYLNAIFTQKGDGWEEKKLKDLINISHGYAFKGADFETSNDVEKPIVLTPGNYSENGELYFNAKNTKRLTSSSPPYGYIFNVGDLTVVMTDLSSKMKILGKPAFVEHQNILHNQRIGRIILKNKLVSPRYLFYFLRTRIVANKIKVTATGTMVRHTAPQRILSNKIPIPKCFDDQVQVTSKLDKLYSETQRLEVIYRQKIAALNELKQSILQKAFTGELTADTVEKVA